MSDELRARLLAAANAGEIVSVVYHRGSQPGSVREIVPIAVTAEEVRARDLAADTDKTFRLAHLELAGPETSAPQYDPAPPVDDRQPFRAMLEPHISALQALGWHVELTDTRISLHGYFKNGKPRKGSDVSLGFDEFTVDMFDDFDGRGLQAVTRPSNRPYNVSSRSLPTRTFAHLPPALALFLEEARKLAPEPPQR